METAPTNRHPIDPLIISTEQSLGISIDSNVTNPLPTTSRSSNEPKGTDGSITPKQRSEPTVFQIDFNSH
jgi:hypothetical protein